MPKNFERRFEEARGAENIEKLLTLTHETSETLNKKGAPVDPDCRVDIDKGMYPEKTIETSKRVVREFNQKWYKGLTEEEIKEERLKRSGEQLEMLITVIFNKFLGSDFVVVRSASYDDIRNKIDTLILNIKTGDIVCAFDEVGATSGYKFEKKKELILEKNRKKLLTQYGLSVDENGEIIICPQKNFPLFYLALSERNIKTAMRELSPSIDESSEFEKKLFDYFISSIDAQIKNLKLERGLHYECKKQLLAFEKTFKEFK